jgi:hypothetical protein
MEKICCVKCSSTNVEEHNIDAKKQIIYYICANCRLHFTNFDYDLNKRLKYKILSIQLKEFNQANLLEFCLKELTSHGIDKIMDPYHVHNFIFGGKSYLEILFNLSFIETMFYHLKKTNTSWT